ncbi:TIR domain-containing protein [Parafrankia sp. FMc6]|uniref:TIR domain-containing protein n=1 Tax=Parafrankia soli TaxID=2599596 RepID=UPI0034D44561
MTVDNEDAPDPPTRGGPPAGTTPPDLDESNRTPGSDGRLRYDAFLSYSHALDGRLAPAVQRGLHRLARRWYRARALRVFRDKTSLAASPDLWGEIERALEQSRYLILLASPTAAASPWVRRETEWWQSHRSSDTLLIALTDGTLIWGDGAAGLSGTADDALPPGLRAWFDREPLWVDLTWAREQNLSVRHSRFRQEIATLAAPIHGISRDDLESEDIRQHRRLLLSAYSAVTVLVVLLAAVIAFGVRAQTAQRQAEASQRTAISRSLMAAADAARGADPQTALRLGIAAHSIGGSVETSASLVETLTTSHYLGTLPSSAGDIQQVIHSPDGRFLATLTEDRADDVNEGATVVLWDAGDPASRHPVGRTSIPGSQAAVCGAFASDGSFLVVSTERSMAILDLADPAAPRPVSMTFQEPLSDLGPIHSVAISPVAPVLATLHQSADGNVLRLWDLEHPDRPIRLAEVAGTVGGSGSLAFSPDGRVLAAGGGDYSPGNGDLTLWNVTDPASPAPFGPTITDFDGAVQAVAYSPTGQHLALGIGSGGNTFSYGSTLLLDVGDPAAPRVTQMTVDAGTGAVYAVAFSPDGRVLASGGADFTVATWDLSGDSPSGSPRQLTRPLSGHTAVIETLSFRPVDRVDPVDPAAEGPDAGFVLASGSFDRTVMMWNVPDVLRPRPTEHSSTGADISYLAGDRKSGLVAVGSSATDRVTFWDVAGADGPRAVGAPLTDLPGVSLAAFSPGGSLFAVATDEQIVLWDMTTPQRPRRLPTSLAPARSRVMSLAFTSDNSMLIAGGSDGDVTSWSIARLAEEGSSTGGPRLPKMSHTGLGSGGVTVAPNGKLLATAAGGTAESLVLWDISSGPPRRLGEATTPFVGSIMTTAFSPDSRILVGGTLDGHAVVWDVAEPATPSRIGDPLTLGIADRVDSVAFDGDGRTLVVGAFGGRVGLWDLTDQSRPRPLGELVSGALAPLTFSTGGQLVSATDSGSLTRWDLSPLEEARDDPLRFACARGGTGGLSPRAWAFYAPGIPYRDPCDD